MNLQRLARGLGLDVGERVGRMRWGGKGRGQGADQALRV